jgi:hypothetical protein
VKVIWEKDYGGFESLYDLERDISEAFDSRFNPNMNEIDSEFQGTMKVVITYEPDEKEQGIG